MVLIATEKRLDFWRSVCGCQAGALAFLAALVWRGFIEAGAPAWTLGGFGRDLAIVLAAAIAAKLAAIAVARIALAVEIVRLRAGERRS